MINFLSFCSLWVWIQLSLCPLYIRKWPQLPNLIRCSVPDARFRFGTQHMYIYKYIFTNMARICCDPKLNFDGLWLQLKLCEITSTLTVVGSGLVPQHWIQRQHCSAICTLRRLYILCQRKSDILSDNLDSGSNYFVIFHCLLYQDSVDCVAFFKILVFHALYHVHGIPR